MQIGFDAGTTKIESVVLEDSGEENFRERTDCPKDYNSVIKNIYEITKSLEKKLNKSLPVGVCHPGVHSPQTGLIKNAPNCYWIEKKPFQKDLMKNQCLKSKLMPSDIAKAVLFFSSDHSSGCTNQSYVGDKGWL